MSESKELLNQSKTESMTETFGSNSKEEVCANCGHLEEFHNCYGRFPKGCRHKNTNVNGTICPCKRFKKELK